MKNIYVLFVILLIIGCKNEKTNPIPTKEITKEKEWKYLFDGTSTDGWRAYGGDKLPEQWFIEDGALTFSTEKKLESEFKGGQDIVYGAEEFDNFELELEWKLPEGGNSGIFYHVKDGYSIPEIAPEYQLLDDLKWEEINNAKLEEWQKTGADYAMHVPDKGSKIVKPAGEWNSSKIIFTPDHAEHWLNGKKLLEFDPWSEDWERRKMSGKWKDSPKYGTFKSGFIGLQDHDSPIWFKNIRIRKL